MHELILHNYDASPFAEKVRLLMGFKQLSWRWVDIPRMMPKPDLLALSGGYRKTPVLQIGADIYCDTALIARRLDAEKSTPALFPEGQEFTTSVFAQWVDSEVFLHAVSLVFQPEAMAARMGKLPVEVQKAFMADRGGLFSGGTASRLPLAQAKQQWPTLMARFEQQLSREEGDFLFGSASVADFALAHCLWFLKSSEVTSPFVDAYPAVAAWLGRVLGFGHGSHSPLSAEDAIAIAKAATPVALPTAPSVALENVQIGDQVTVSATDYGVDPVAGVLLFAGTEELIVSREDPRAGVVHVHFPRMGFKVECAK